MLALIRPPVRTRKEVELELLDREPVDSQRYLGSTSWISCGLNIEAERCVLVHSGNLPR